MYLGEGIVIGTVHGLQLDEWRSKGIANRREWQLISIFDKDRRAAMTTVKSPGDAGDADLNWRYDATE